MVTRDWRKREIGSCLTVQNFNSARGKRSKNLLHNNINISNSNTLATSCKELTHWKRLWCWEGLGAGGEGDNRGWDGWMASPTQWTWVWVNSRSWWWTGRPGVLRFMGSQRVGHDWATELNWIFKSGIFTFHRKVKMDERSALRPRSNHQQVFINI